MKKILLILVPLTLCALFLSLQLGASGISIWGWRRLLTGEATPLEGAILLELRLPRTLIGLLGGMALGLSGAALQGLLRNPLAEPGVMGISSGSALAAVAAYYFLGGMGWSVPLAAILGALAIAAMLMFAAGQSGGGFHPASGGTRLILAGVGLASLSGACVALIISMLPNPFAIADITFWLMGSLADRSWLHLGLSAPPMLLGMALLFTCGPSLRALSLGEETALSMGVPLTTCRRRLILGVALATGGAVAAMGAVGFIGLVAPHLMRGRVSHDPAHLLWPSALAGGLLLLASDMCVRMLPYGSIEPRLGVITALIGAPCLLWILRRGAAR